MVTEQDGKTVLVDTDTVEALEVMLGLARTGEINGIMMVGMRSLGKCRHDIPQTAIAGLSVAQCSLSYMGAFELLRRDLSRLVWEAETERAGG